MKRKSIILYLKSSGVTKKRIACISAFVALFMLVNYLSLFAIWGLTERGRPPLDVLGESVGPFILGIVDLLMIAGIAYLCYGVLKYNRRSLRISFILLGISGFLFVALVLVAAIAIV